MKSRRYLTNNNKKISNKDPITDMEEIDNQERADKEFRKIL